MSGKLILFFIKSFFASSKFFILFFIKIFIFNLMYVIESLVYVVHFMLLTPIIIIKFIIYLKQIGGLFLHNCNFILTISLLRYFFRKIMIKYGLNLLIFNKLSIYLFALHNYISCFVITNIY